jgi:uncharacterized integral membrane protein
VNCDPKKIINMTTNSVYNVVYKHGDSTKRLVMFDKFHVGGICVYKSLTKIKYNIIIIIIIIIIIAAFAMESSKKNSDSNMI